MSASIAHRGPDDEGFALFDSRADRHWTFASPRSPAEIRERWPVLDGDAAPAHDVALAQVRFSIIDLSPAGHQPMWSECGRVCVTFNGEIYNYLELRAELISLGREFRTRSDTEVLVQGYLEWGEDVLRRLNGFFAIALYDRLKKAVLLARDRLGKTHLYIRRREGESIHWASEIKAFFAAGCADKSRIDEAAVAEFVLYQWRDRGGTFWKEVEDFPPACHAWIDARGEFAPVRYWELPQRRLTTADLSLNEAAAGVRGLLADALDIRLRADVPIGFELSGGMDSSALVGLAAGVLGRRLTSYTIQFDEAHSNEEPYARAVRDRYPDLIDYRVIRQPADDFWQDADRFIRVQEEPFHAPNLQTNEHLRRIIKADRTHVVITGAAGDEMLAGYPADYLGPFLRHLLSEGRFHTFVRELFASTELTPMRGLWALASDTLLSEETRARLVKRRLGEWPLLERVLPADLLGLPPRRPSVPADRTFHGRTLANMTFRLMDYWLRSGSKVCYAIPIEARLPFLDFRVVEYCCRLPPEYLIRDGWHKYVLRTAVSDLLPEAVVWRRRKMGFPFPYREWLAASKAVAARNVADSACPYVSATRLFENYDALVRVAPVTLWRMLSVLLWWRRVIEERPVVAE